jgi:OOP family OmpA-OmpF porin
VALVGHTDSSGTLGGNIALSKQRAGSVLERLVSDYGANRRQLEAEGMGYLSPIANNLTETGREANRRVEVIITSSE